MQKNVMTKRNKILMMAFLILFLMIMPITVRATADTTLPAEVDGVITLKNDVELSERLVVDKNVTIDLNGYKLNANITVKGTLTVKDTANNSGVITCTDSIRVEGGTFTLNSGKIENINQTEQVGKNIYGIFASENGIVNINGGKILSKSAPLAGNNGTGVMTFKVTGGTLEAKQGPAIYMPGPISLDITGGELIGGISLRMGIVNISGGTINAVKSDIDSPKDYYAYSGNAWLPDALYVFNGTYTTDVKGYTNELKLNITGGTFNCENDIGSAIAIYDIGKVEQKSSVSISGNAVLNTNSKDREAYQILTLSDIGVDTPKAGYGNPDYVGKVNTEITGGTYSTDVSKYLTEKYTIKQENGKYIVKEIVDIAKCDITGISNKTYTGKALKQTIVISYNGETLKEDVDYTIKYTNNTKPGKATVTINGKGVYKGTTSKTFIITPKKLDGLKVDSQTTSTVKLSWTKHEGVTGYEIYSYNYSNKKWECIDKTSKNSYTIKKLSASTTYKYKVRAYVTIDKKQYYGSYTSNLKTATKPKTTKVKATAGDKKITIKWNKVSGVTGYQVYMATSKNGKYTKIKTIKNNKTFNYTKSGLNANKKYYFKVRAYKQVDDKKVCSSYTEIVSAKTKKVHVIKKGDTLYSIAKKNKTTVAKLAKINGLKKVAVLKIGYRLLLN